MIKNNTNNNILYTGAFRFPQGDAAALRVFTIATLLGKYNNHVTFAGWEENKGPYTYKGHQCFSQAGLHSKKQRKPLHRLMKFIFRGAGTLKWLYSHNHYNIIFVYNPPTFFALGVLLFGFIFKRTIVLDSTEWYESDHLPGGKYGLAAIENKIRMQLIYPLFNNVICISAYLEKHYRKHNKNVVIIPPMMSGDRLPSSENIAIQDDIHFIYAGEPGRKDDIFSFIKILGLIEKSINKKVFLHIAGVEKDDFFSLLTENGLSSNSYLKYLLIHGVVKRSSIINLYSKVHFSILFREEKRYALAGFPTKVVESWSRGCPVISNFVGDIKLYAKDGVNSIYVASDSLESLPELLKPMINTISHQKLKKNSLETYEKYFTVDSNMSHFSAFLRKIYE